MSDVSPRVAAERKRIEAALEPGPSPGMSPGAVLTGFVVVSEWITPEGDRHLVRLDSEGSTAWWRHGMLAFALDENYWQREDPDGA